MICTMTITIYTGAPGLRFSKALDSVPLNMRCAAKKSDSSKEKAVQNAKKKWL